MQKITKFGQNQIFSLVSAQFKIEKIIDFSKAKGHPISLKSEFFHVSIRECLNDISIYSDLQNAVTFNKNCSTIMIVCGLDFFISIMPIYLKLNIRKNLGSILCYKDLTY